MTEKLICSDCADEKYCIGWFLLDSTGRIGKCDICKKEAYLYRDK